MDSIPPERYQSELSVAPVNTHGGQVTAVETRPDVMAANVDGVVLRLLVGIRLVEVLRGTEAQDVRWVTCASSCDGASRATGGDDPCADRDGSCRPQIPVRGAGRMGR